VFVARVYICWLECAETILIKPLAINSLIALLASDPLICEMNTKSNETLKGT